jgi:hypothetical protein
MADEGKKQGVERQPTYHVENTVRRVGTRLHRARSATRHRFKIFLGGRRILRNKKLPLTEEQFKQFEERIKEMILAGKVALHMPDGTRVTSSPDGRLIYRRLDGAVKVGEAPEPAPKKAPPKPKPAPKAEPEVVTSAEPAEPDDLTSLPNIGAGRARKLEAEGYTSFQSLVDAGSATLAELLGVAEEVAEEIIAAAEGE